MDKVETDLVLFMKALARVGMKADLEKANPSTL